MVALKLDHSPLVSALRLIQRYRLHDGGAPVDLRPLENMFVPLVVEGSFHDYTSRRLDPDTISERRPAYIVLSTRHWLPQHVRFAHEIGHILCRHFGSVRLLQVDPVFNERQEREAWSIAALLLIPLDFIVEKSREGWTKAQIASACFLPEWLVDLYPR